MPFHAIRGMAHLLRVFSSFTVHLKNADVSFIYSWKNKAQLMIIAIGNSKNEYLIQFRGFIKLFSTTVQKQLKTKKECFLLAS